MGAIAIELPYNYDDEDVVEFFEYHQAKHLPAKNRTHLTWIVKTNDGVRLKNGVVCRVVDTVRNEVGEPFMVIANKKFTEDELNNLWYRPVELCSGCCEQEATKNGLCKYCQDDDEITEEEEMYSARSNLENIHETIF